MRAWNFYTAKEIKPEGWLRRQLEIQASGLAGNLDNMWPDVRDSAWIGGEREGWERVPYWLDGFIPLAYLLEDEGMIARAKKYVDAILASQKESGWICPCREEEIPTYDTWAVQLISKVLVNYYECSGDERIPAVLYRVMKNYYELLVGGEVKLFEWGEMRWFEAFIAIDFLRARYDDPWIPALAKLLKAEGTEFEALVPLWHTPKNVWTLKTHIVNLAMMLKYEAVSTDALGESYTDRAEYLRTVLATYHGTAVDTFTGDECLSGLSPIQGTELCAVVEQMYSYELLYAYTGDPKWAERLERIAFNAFPATVSEDMWTHQYVQLSNQIACPRFPNQVPFRTVGPEANQFGLEPHYGCCTANMGQGWPKLTLSSFLYAGDTVLSAIPLPSSLEADTASVRLATEYPFENTFTYTVDAHRDMTLAVRIPSFARGLTVDGKPVAKTELLSFRFAKGEQRTLRIEYSVAPEIVSRPHDLISVRLGSLVFSLPITAERRVLEFERDGVSRRAPYCDYEMFPASKWNYALSDVRLSYERHGVSEIPFSESHPPVTVRARLTPIDWGYADGHDYVCAKTPASRTPIGEEIEATLIPYGCAKLRMTEIPLI